MPNLHHFLTLALAAAGTATAHMQMSYPPPLKSQTNPNTASADYSMTSPLKADGSDFPCKGYLPLLGTPEGGAVASWAAGQSYNFTITGGAAHGGGSCQAALSVDGGRSFRVVHSYEGGCPGEGESSFGFVVPGDTPAGEGAVFAWTWFNNIGNREMYMNCAVVDIVGGGGGAGGVAFASRPGLFTANIGNGCRTVDSADVKFPDPGPDVDAGAGATAPTGSCGSTGAGGGSTPGSGSGAGSGSAQGSEQNSGGTSGEPSPSIPTVIVPAPSTQADPMPVTNGPGKGWTPGNDWPGWFESGASKTSSCVLPIVSFWMLLLAYLLV
ncbi:uncharacterized protein B0H64DRAFT_457340 [Chaetomium fimeti]|uniref:Extracellular protein n=1 Tax=Chaetomium fimeti TaxID=1854472 RepID=A0AAE0HJ86_9PEZI|nr:hypothetical protein B0H64DRAFT_457340 [Chaetomium fimeti]